MQNHAQPPSRSRRCPLLPVATSKSTENDANPQPSYLPPSATFTPVSTEGTNICSKPAFFWSNPHRPHPELLARHPNPPHRSPSNSTSRPSKTPSPSRSRSRCSSPPSRTTASIPNAPQSFSTLSNSPPLMRSPSPSSPMPPPLPAPSPAPAQDATWRCRKTRSSTWPAQTLRAPRNTGTGTHPR